MVLFTPTTVCTGVREINTFVTQCTLEQSGGCDVQPGLFTQMAVQFAMTDALTANTWSHKKSSSSLNDCTYGKCPRNGAASSAQTYIVETQPQVVAPLSSPSSTDETVESMTDPSTDATLTPFGKLLLASSSTIGRTKEEERDSLFDMYIPCLRMPTDCSKVLSQMFGDKLSALISRQSGVGQATAANKIRLTGTPVAMGSPQFSTQLARQLEHLNLCRDCSWFFKVSVPKSLAISFTKEQDSRRRKTEHTMARSNGSNTDLSGGEPSVYTFQFAWVQPLGDAVVHYGNVLKSLRTVTESFVGMDIQLPTMKPDETLLPHDDTSMDESFCCATNTEAATKEAGGRYLQTIHRLMQHRVDSELQLQAGEWVEKRNAMAIISGSSFLPSCSNASTSGWRIRFFVGGFDFPNDMYGLAYFNVKLSENIKNSFQVDDCTININVKHVRYLSLADLTTSLHASNMYFCNNYNSVMVNHTLVHRHRKRCTLTHTGCLTVDTTRHQSLDVHQMEFVTLPSVNGCHVFKCDRRVAGEPFDMDISAMPLELLPLSLLVLSEAVLMDNKGDRKYFYVMTVKRMQNSNEETRHYFLDTTKSVDMHDVKAVYATEAFDLFYAKMIASL